MLRPAEYEKDEQVLVLLAIALNQTANYSGALAAVNQALDLRSNDKQALQLKQEIQASAQHD